MIQNTGHLHRGNHSRTYWAQHTSPDSDGQQKPSPTRQRPTVDTISTTSDYSELYRNVESRSSNTKELRETMSPQDVQKKQMPRHWDHKIVSVTVQSAPPTVHTTRHVARRQKEQRHPASRIRVAYSQHYTHRVHVQNRVTQGSVGSSAGTSAILKKQVPTIRRSQDRAADSVHKIIHGTAIDEVLLVGQSGGRQHRRICS